MSLEFNLNGTHTTAVANGSRDGTVFRLGLFNFAEDDTGTGLTGFTQYQSGNVSLVSGELALQSAASYQNPGQNTAPGQMNASDPYVFINAPTDGDFTVIVHFTDYPTALGTQSITMNLGCRFDDLNWSQVSTTNNAANTTTGRYYVNGVRNLSAGKTAPAEKWWKFKRVGNAWYGSYADTVSDLLNEVGTYTLISGLTYAFGSAGYVYLSAVYVAGPQGTAKFDDLQFISGFTGTAQCLVGDSGTGAGRHIDAGGDNETLDWTTFDVALTQYTTATFDVKGKAVASFDGSEWDNETPLTLEQMQAYVDANNWRYWQIRVNLTATADATSPALSAVVVNAVTIDVTPPAVPTVLKMKRLNTSNYGIIWTEPADADYNHCELLRVIGSTNYYLNAVDGLPVWEETVGTPYEFIDGDALADWQQSNYVDEGVSGTPSYFVRSVDDSDNASGWTAAELEISGSVAPISLGGQSRIGVN